MKREGQLISFKCQYTDDLSESLRFSLEASTRVERKNAVANLDLSRKLKVLIAEISTSFFQCKQFMRTLID